MVTKANTTNINKVLHLLDKLVFGAQNNYSEHEAMERWNIYTDILDQLKSLDHTNYFDEIYHRLLLDHNINTILIDIINGDNELYLLLYCYTYMLEEFFDFDEIKIFV